MNVRAHAEIRTVGPLAVSQEVLLSSEQTVALRLREVNVKEAFTLCDARGAYFRASLTQMDDQGARALVYEAMDGSPESPLALTLVCAVLGRQRMLQVIQKATELGVTRIVPVLSAFSVKPQDLEKEKPWAWPAQAVRAVRQCRRARVPTVEKPISLGAALKDGALTKMPWFILDDGAAHRARIELEPFAAVEAALLVGPEGGFSDEERALFKVHENMRAIRLGARVLRAETAVYAGLAIVQHLYGDLH
jgi:16S rRNA (uracil1498-N3)-methyltransferase